MDPNIEKEMCNNCKKEIPQPNYVMHTMHCARNITLCKVCNEPIPKIDYERHKEKCRPAVVKKPSPLPVALEKSSYFQQRKSVEDQKAAARRETYLRKHQHLVDDGFTLRESVSNGYENSSSPSRSNSSISNSTSSYNNLSSSSSTSRLYSSANQNYSDNKYQPKEASNSYIPYSSQANKSLPNPSSSVRPQSRLVNDYQANEKQSNDAKSGYTNEKIGAQNGAIKKPPLIPRLDDGLGMPSKGSKGLLACRHCDLELPKLDLEEHENYCGTRTDKCLECGELVMFKNKQVHIDSNHGFVKLKDEPGSRPSWDSSSHRSSEVESSPTRRRLERVRLADIDYDPMPYLPAAYQPGGGLKKKKEGETYKEISRRLDCKTEYIRNLLHDSASITIPLRSSGTAPRNHFNHNKGPAPQPPRRRRNPPTELTIPCEFCDTPIPHEELIQHETGCRPDLARFNPRRSRASVPLPDEDDYTPYVPYEPVRTARTPPRGDSPDAEELPCEFCANMVPASQLWRHQMSCTQAAA